MLAKINLFIIILIVSFNIAGCMKTDQPVGGRVDRYAINDSVYIHDK